VCIYNEMSGAVRNTSSFSSSSSYKSHRGSYDGDGGRWQRGRSWSPSPVSEGSEERRAQIEQWNREREAAQA
jgi:splicing factor U2AF 35 kDa subunit